MIESVVSIELISDSVIVSTVYECATFHCGILKGNGWEQPNTISFGRNNTPIIGKGYANLIFNTHTNIKSHYNNSIVFTLSQIPQDIQGIEFCIATTQGQWIKNNNQNYLLDIKGFRDQISFKNTLGCQQVKNVSPQLTAGIKVETTTQNATVSVYATGNEAKDLVLHWGTLCKGEWVSYDPKTLVLSQSDSAFVVDTHACQTTFKKMEESQYFLACLCFPAGLVPKDFVFVLKTAKGTWYKDTETNGDFHVQIPDDEFADAAEEMKAEIEEQKKVLEDSFNASRHQFLEEYSSLKERMALVTTVSIPNVEGDSESEELDDSEDEDTEAFTECEGAVPASVLLQHDHIELNKDMHLKWYLEYDHADKTANLSIEMISQTQPTLHWGVVKRGDWECGDQAWNENSKKVSDSASDVCMEEIRPFYFRSKFNIPCDHNDGELGLDFSAFKFIFKLPPNNWVKNPEGHDFTVMMNKKKVDSGDEIGQVIVEAECEWNSITLMHRYNCVNDMISNKEYANDTGRLWSWIFVWLRFNQLAWLDWQRRYNTRPSELAHSTERLSLKLGDQWKAANPKGLRIWIRMCMSMMGRGGGNGQKIRDQILHIMHGHAIKETNDHFYEQWHQKLHNNTTPDDIGICKAIIKYYETGGKLDQYWNVLHDHGITKERLASYERPINTEPYWHDCNTGAFIGDLYAYLGTLQQVHDAQDLGRSANYVRGVLNDHDKGELDSLLHDLHTCHDQLSPQHAINRLKKISYLRGTMHSKCEVESNQWVVRDLLILDFSLETQQSLTLQNTSKESMQLHEVLCLIEVCINDWSRSTGDPEEWSAISKDVMSLGSKCADGKLNGHQLDGLLLKAICDRINRAVGTYTDFIQDHLGPKSQLLGSRIGIDTGKLDIFVEEVIRGTSLFGIAICTKLFDRELRKRIHLPPWQIISPVAAVTGHIVRVKALINMQQDVYSEPTVLICDQVSGEEDIPSGVVAVVIRDGSVSAPDVLAHVSVRARNEKVLLVACHEQAEITKTDGMKYCRIELSAGFTSLEIKEITPEVFAAHVAASGGTSGGTADSAGQKLDIKFNNPSQSFAIPNTQYSKDLVGGKSLNLETLRQTLTGGEYKIPMSLALPFGSMDRVFGFNSTQSKQIQRIIAAAKGVDNEKVIRIFRKCCKVVDLLTMPPEMLKGITEAMPEMMQEVFDRNGPEKGWAAIKSVWKSMFNIRPWVALTKANRSWNDVRMAILIQELVDAKYSFVLHSKHPYRSEDEASKYMYGELVIGLGETLVGNYPGRALSWEGDREGNVTICAWPSKSIALVCESSLIYRSDSNGEDLEGFAGAGLFESVTASSMYSVPCVYCSCPLICDVDYRDSTLSDLTKAAFDIASRFGNEVDVEGCINAQDQIVIVQARPQV